MCTCERNLKLNSIFGGQGFWESAWEKINDLHLHLEQRVWLLCFWAEIGAVRLWWWFCCMKVAAEATTLGSSWVQPNAIYANAWLELFLDHLYFCFLPTPFGFPSACHGFLNMVWVGETLLLSFEFMPFGTTCCQALFFLHFRKQKKIHVETGKLFSAVFRKLVFCSI